MNQPLAHKGQIIANISDAFILDPATISFDTTIGSGLVGSFTSNARQLAIPSQHNPADRCNQRGQLSGYIPFRFSWIHLLQSHSETFQGSILAMWQLRIVGFARFGSLQIVDLITDHGDQRRPDTARFAAINRVQHVAAPIRAAITQVDAGPAIPVLTGRWDVGTQKERFLYQKWGEVLVYLANLGRLWDD